MFVFFMKYGERDERKNYYLKKILNADGMDKKRDIKDQKMSDDTFCCELSFSYDLLRFPYYIFSTFYFFKYFFVFIKKNKKTSHRLHAASTLLS